MRASNTRLERFGLRPTLIQRQSQSGRILRIGARPDEA